MRGIHRLINLRTYKPKNIALFCAFMFLIVLQSFSQTGCLSVFVLPANAQKTDSLQSGYLEKLTVDLQINEDSTVSVQENLEGLYLTYPIFVWTINAENPTKIEVFESGSLISNSRVEMQKGDVTSLEIPLTYYSNTDLVLSYTLKDQLKIKDERVFIKHIIFDRPQIEIGEVEVNLNLPDVSKNAANYIRSYAIHGIENSDHKIISETELQYKATNAASLSTLTIEDQFTNNNIKFSFWQKTEYYFSNLESIELLIFALVFPLITLLVLLYYHLRFRQSVKIKKGLEPLDKPPSEISPALVGLLYRGDITSYSISATILDLIRRDLVLVVDKGDAITFGRYVEKKPALNFEEHLLAEIFKKQKIKSGLKDIKELEEKELTDPLFAKAYKEIYQRGEELGFFRKSPHKTKIIQHLAGIILFILSILFYVLVIIFFPAKPILILSPFGMTVGSFLILHLARITPPRTGRGREEIEKWLSFKKYLLGHHPISSENNLAMKYLPYAETLGATDDWVNHFKKLTSQVPDFYISSSPYTSTEEWMVKTINAAREIAIEIEELKGY